MLRDSRVGFLFFEVAVRELHRLLIVLFGFQTLFENTHGLSPGGCVNVFSKDPRTTPQDIKTSLSLFQKFV